MTLWAPNDPLPTFMSKLLTTRTSNNQDIPAFCPFGINYLHDLESMLQADYDMGKAFYNHTHLLDYLGK